MQLKIFILLFWFFALPVFAADHLKYHSFIFQNQRLHLIHVPKNYQLKPFAFDRGLILSDVVKRNGALAGINGGYFNHSDGQPVSQVIAEGKIIADPQKNLSLILNPILKPILNNIFAKRVELRLLQKNDLSESWQIVSHDQPLPPGNTLIHSLQAGPKLLPGYNPEQEGFIIKNEKGEVIRDGIGTLSRAARSAVGITKSGELILVMIEGSYEKRTGVTMKQLAEVMKNLGAETAMALDGGSSSTLTWKSGNIYKTITGSGKSPARLNSVLLIFPPKI